jgi:hypothetical protein
MSRGPGRIQQEIAANPDGAWTVGDLCRLVYRLSVSRFVVGGTVYVKSRPPLQKKHRVAVARALRRMELPPMWRVAQLHRRAAEYCLYNTGSPESTKQKYYLNGWPHTMRGPNHGPRSRSPDGGTASNTRRASARRWRACCQGHWRPGLRCWSHADEVVHLRIPLTLRARARRLGTRAPHATALNRSKRSANRSRSGRSLMRPGRWMVSPFNRLRDSSIGPSFLPSNRSETCSR